MGGEEAFAGGRRLHGIGEIDGDGDFALAVLEEVGDG
jgi:hypothetical protein